MPIGSRFCFIRDGSTCKREENILLFIKKREIVRGKAEVGVVWISVNFGYCGYVVV